MVGLLHHWPSLRTSRSASSTSTTRAADSGSTAAGRITSVIATSSYAAAASSSRGFTLPLSAPGSTDPSPLYARRMTRTVALLGATGYTGRLTAAELERRGIPHRVGGRSKERLAEGPAAGGRPRVGLGGPGSPGAFPG